MTPGQKLRRALASENVVFAPLTLDALTGRIAEQAGFPAGYISGGGPRLVGNTPGEWIAR